MRKLRACVARNDSHFVRARLCALPLSFSPFHSGRLSLFLVLRRGARESSSAAAERVGGGGGGGERELRWNSTLILARDNARSSHLFRLFWLSSWKGGLHDERESGRGSETEVGTQSQAVRARSRQLSFVCLFAPRRWMCWQDSCSWDASGLILPRRLFSFFSFYHSTPFCSFFWARIAPRCHLRRRGIFLCLTLRARASWNSMTGIVSIEVLFCKTESTNDTRTYNLSFSNDLLIKIGQC